MVPKNDNTAVAGKQKTLTIDRTFDLPLSSMWKAWTDPEYCKKLQLPVLRN